MDKLIVKMKIKLAEDFIAEAKKSVEEDQDANAGKMLYHAHSFLEQAINEIYNPLLKRHKK